MPSNKTVALVVVYTGKNSQYDVIISKCKEKKEKREKRESEREIVK